MEKLAIKEVLRKLALGEVDLDEICEVIRAAELVIQTYRAEAEGLRRSEEKLQTDLEKERQSVDELIKRLAELHQENSLAREVFCTEIEGKRTLLGITSGLDLQALNMEGLIRERENVQKLMGKILGAKTDQSLKAHQALG